VATILASPGGGATIWGGGTVISGCATPFRLNFSDPSRLRIARTKAT